MDIFESSPKEKFFDIVFNANRNLVEEELENLFTKFIAISELAEKAGIDEPAAGSFALENQDLINERLNDLFIGSVANILSQNE
ncbi:MAG: DUF2018 family protein [Campylobacter sp.]